MKLTDDIKSRRLLHAKGLLFLFLGLFASLCLVLDRGDLKTVILLGIVIWAFCRFYYYLFYVLEKYAGRERKYAGLWDALTFVIRKSDS